MAFQIRFTAVWRLVNFRTGLTPGRLFQISTRREAGHFAASFARSVALRKRSVSGLLSASVAEANAVMLLSRSIVKMVISYCLLSPDLRLHDIHHSGSKSTQSKSAAEG